VEKETRGSIFEDIEKYVDSNQRKLKNRIPTLCPSELGNYSCYRIELR